ncbi:MAG: tetratricopeptide repeat protein [Polyangiaceae bacterium]|nr:tetratricopeptide repeat protein [Myxococcales bacterium]MCB9587858.1 tetratricopeptide repeat protein [Polyangiaceae bacterium]MCB9608807.1 tetratricopeptide repeat protein [Polyangiaceae bacterium]
MRLISFGLMLLTLWSLYDATKRRAPAYWYFLLVLGFPIGAILYLVWSKLQGFDPVEQQLEHADRLERQQNYLEAAKIYGSILEIQPSRPRALHGQARCAVERGELPRALELYDRLMRVDPRYREYSAALEYAETLTQCNRAEDAADLMRGLVRESPKPNHRLALAHYLNRSGQPAAARSNLEAFLADNPPEPWRQRAQSLLEETSETQH